MADLKRVASSPQISLALLTASMGMKMVSPLATLQNHYSEHTYRNAIKTNAPDTILSPAIRVHKRCIQRNDIVLHHHSYRRWHRGVYAESLAYDGVKIRKGCKIIHGRGIGGYAEQLLAEFRLDFWGLGECEQGPCRSRTFVTHSSDGVLWDGGLREPTLWFRDLPPGTIWGRNFDNR